MSNRRVKKKTVIFDFGCLRVEPTTAGLTVTDLFVCDWGRGKKCAINSLYFG